MEIQLDAAKELENGDVEEEWQVYRSGVVGCTLKVCGVRQVEGWNEEGKGMVV